LLHKQTANYSRKYYSSTLYDIDYGTFSFLIVKAYTPISHSYKDVRITKMLKVNYLLRFTWLLWHKMATRYLI